MGSDGLTIKSGSLEIESAEVDGEIAAEGEDGRRIRDGTRLRVSLDGSVPLLFGIVAGLGARGTFGDGGRSGGAWLERSLTWRNRHVEARIGLTRTFWGDGSSGSLLLGRTAPPLEKVQIRTNRPIRIPYTGSIGTIHGSFFLAYLDDRYRTVPYPLLNGTRIEWEPSGWFRLAATRMILLGGSGRTNKLTAGDLWDIWWGKNENLVGDRPISDTDQKASFTAEVRLPPDLSPWRLLEGARFFYEYAGEDSFDGWLPTAVAHHIGGSISIAGWVGLVEFLETNDDANYWYTNHSVYGPQSYFYRDYILGHWMGRDSQLGHIRFWSPPIGRNRCLLWVRSRGLWDRLTQQTPVWVDGVGFRFRRPWFAGTTLDLGLELSRTHGTADPLPKPGLPWRIDLAVRTDRFRLY